MAVTVPHIGEECQAKLPQKGEGWETIISSKLPDMGNHLKELRKEKGWTHDQAAAEMGVSRGQFIKLERGERKMTENYIRQAARAFKVPTDRVLSSPETVPLVGFVGAGAEATLYSEAQGPFGEVPAIEGATEETVAVEIRGGSLGALFDRWLCYYEDRRDPPTRDMMKKLCVVGLEDGRVLVKQLLPSRIDGYFDLLSNNEPPIYEVAVAWAAIVIGIRPR
jgi:transcriptional regulator with XRE-family HTH domain